MADHKVYWSVLVLRFRSLRIDQKVSGLITLIDSRYHIKFFSEVTATEDLLTFFWPLFIVEDVYVQAEFH